MRKSSNNYNSQNPIITKIIIYLNLLYFYTCSYNILKNNRMTVIVKVLRLCKHLHILNYNAICSECKEKLLNIK